MQRIEYYKLMINKIPAYFQEAYGGTPEKVSVLDNDRKVLWINNSFHDFLKYKYLDAPPGLLGRDYASVLREHMQEDEFIIDNICEGLDYVKQSTERCFTYEFPFYRVDQPMWLMLVACCIIDKTDGEQYTVAKFYNITEHYNRRKRENKRDDNNIVRQLISESMHTWRQPLNSISLFIQDLKEQFDDNTLTKYYMNFASKQINSEIKRLSESIDEMSEFYTNDTDEDTINLSEAIFQTIKKTDKVLLDSNIFLSLNCHALGNVPSENFIQLSETFRIRCGTGTKKCFNGCNKGNIVVYGDKVMFNYIIRMIITMGSSSDEGEKNIHFELTIEDSKLHVHINFDYAPSSPEDNLRFLKSLFDNNFKGTMTFDSKIDRLKVTMSFSEFKTKTIL